MLRFTHEDGRRIITAHLSGTTSEYAGQYEAVH